MEPSLSLEGSKLGSLPVLADQEALTSGTQPLGAGCLQPSTYCDHTGTAAMGARAAPLCFISPVPAVPSARGDEEAESFPGCCAPHPRLPKARENILVSLFGGIV